MSWLSEFLHSPLSYVKENPLKALALLAAPAAAVAAPFAAPAIGGALGLGGAAAGAEGAAAGGSGLFGGLFGAGEAAGAGAGGGALAFGEGAGLGETALGFAGGEGFGLGGAGLGEGLGGGLGGIGEGIGEGVGGLGAGLGEGATGGLSTGTTDFLSSLGVGDVGSDALGSFAQAETPFETNLDYISRVWPGQFDPSGLPVEGAGGAEGALGGISTDPSMAGAPLASSMDPATATAEAGGEGFWSRLGSGAIGSLTKNPLGIAAAGVGLGLNVLRGNQTSPEMKALGTNAAALNAQGQQLMSYLQSGTLPAGLQQAVNNATSAMKARIIANHARNGMPTDPGQNSALSQELNNVDMQAVALIAQKGQELLNSGMNATNMSNQLYGMLEQFNRQQSQQMGQAIASFAAALSGPSIRITR